MNGASLAVSPRYLKATGCTGRPQLKAAWNAAFPKGKTVSPRVVVPSGKTATRSPVFSLAPIARTKLIAARKLPRSMNKVPLARAKNPMSGQLATSFLAVKVQGACIPKITTSSQEIWLLTTKQGSASGVP
jgi:hypothetical protein